MPAWRSSASWRARCSCTHTWRLASRLCAQRINLHELKYRSFSSNLKFLRVMCVLQADCILMLQARLRKQSCACLRHTGWMTRSDFKTRRFRIIFTNHVFNCATRPNALLLRFRATLCLAKKHRIKHWMSVAGWCNDCRNCTSPSFRCRNRNDGLRLKNCECSGKCRKWPNSSSVSLRKDELELLLLSVFWKPKCEGCVG